MTEDDVRQMLHRHAGDVTPSPGAWEQIRARIEADERPVAVVRRHPFRVVAGGAAAAALAALVVGQVLPGTPTTQVATPTTEATSPAPASGIDPPDFPYVFPEPGSSAIPALDPVKAAEHFLEARSGRVPGEPRVVEKSSDSYWVRFDEGPVQGEVFLRRDGRRWWVDSAASDIVPLGDTAYDGRRVTGGVGIESEGTLRISYRGAGDQATTEEREVAFRELVQIDHEIPGEAYVVVGVTLTAPDGTVSVSETWVPNPGSGAVGPDAGEGADTYRGVYPAFTGDELAGYEDLAADGDATYTDPRSVAGAFLGERFLPRDTSEVGYSVGDFRQGDALSGEVPFTLTDGGQGIVAVRTPSAEARTWYVVFATTEPQAFDVRVEGDGTTVEPADGVTVSTAEMQPLPGGDLVTGEPADGLLRFEGVTDGIVKLVGTDAGGRTVLLMSRVAAAG